MKQPKIYISKTHEVCAKIIKAMAIIALIIGVPTFFVGGFIFVIMSILFLLIPKLWVLKSNDIPKTSLAVITHYFEHGKVLAKAKTDFPRYIDYRYNIKDPLTLQKVVIKEGYIEKADISTSLHKLKNEELKNVLEKHNLPTSGKKQILVNRILSELDTDVLNLDCIYIPTEKGKELLKEFDYLFLIDLYGLEIEEYEAAKEKYSKYLTTNDIIFRALNDKFNTYNCRGDFGLARNELFHMAMLLKSEKRYTDCLYFLIKVLYYDLSGMTNGGYIEDVLCLSVAPGLYKEIKSLSDYYSVEIVDKVYSLYKLPYHYFSKDIFFIILEKIFNNEKLSNDDICILLQ